MIKKCKYSVLTPFDYCINCELFLETCFFIITDNGYMLGSECDAYFCDCCNESCIYKY